MAGRTIQQGTSKGTAGAKHLGLAILLPAVLAQQTLGALCFPVGRYGLQIIEPFTFAFYRFLLAAAVLLTLVRFQNPSPPIERADYKRIFGLGLLIILGNQVTYLFAQSLTAAGHGAVLFATTPIWVVAMAVLYLGEKLTWKRGIGGIVALAGSFIIITAGSLRLGLQYLTGDLIMLFSVWAWAAYAVLGKPFAEKYGALRITAYALASGALVYTPFGLYRAMTFDYSQATLGAWGSIVYFAIGSSVGSYVIFYWLLKHMPASRVAMFSNIQPVIATTIAYLFLGERLGAPFFIGGAIVLAGVFLTEM
jgi:drug/metabolite transporter (DMT)-like permease